MPDTADTGAPAIDDLGARESSDVALCLPLALGWGRELAAIRACTGGSEADGGEISGILEETVLVKVGWGIEEDEDARSFEPIKGEAAGTGTGIGMVGWRKGGGGGR